MTAPGPATALERPAAAAPPALEVAGLCAGYGTSRVLHDIDLVVGAGEIVGVLGRNGMGKTTLVRAITGLIVPFSGRISIGGRAVAGLPPNRIARLGVGLVPEGRQVFANLDVAEHLTAFARPSPGGRLDWTADTAFALFPRLAERRRQLASQLSGGEQQMLAIARALVTNPDLLILDEATEGLAPLVRAEIWRALAALRAKGHAMVVIDKYVQRIVELADRCAIVEKGRVAWQGDAGALRADRALWHRHLGV